MADETVSVGDTVAGTVTEVARQGATVLLDGFAEDPVGFIGCLDYSWRSSRSIPGVGDRVSAEVIAVDRARRQILLSRSATEHPQLWAFLKALRRGQRLSGIVAAVERFGVFVDLDDGPKHPAFPGVGFITMPELSWLVFEDPSEVVAVGQRVTCEFLAFDTTNGEARLSLRAVRPDPFQDFARAFRVGQTLPGTVTKLVPFGAFVRVQDGIQGLVHVSELPATPGRALRVGDAITVTIVDIEPAGRRLALSCRR